MSIIQKKSTSLFLLAAVFLLGSSAYATDIQEQMASNFATEDNLSQFELLSPELTAEEAENVRQAELAEKNSEADKVGQSVLKVPQWQMVLGKSSNVTIEIYQNAVSVGKQFLVARQYGQIRYVFAISAAGHGRSTPSGEYGVSSNPGVSSSGQLWRHMSLTYPSRGENNMDHLTYFRPAIGFHSTAWGLFSALGRADSHGCVRLARPQARRIFALIKNNGSQATIFSYRSGEPNPQDLPLIKKQLAKDLNFIQQTLIRGRTNGDLPMNESEYMSFVNGTMNRATLNEILKRRNLKTVIEIPSGLDLGPVNPPRNPVP